MSTIWEWRLVIFFVVFMVPAKKQFRGKMLTVPIRKMVRFFDRHPFVLRITQLEAQGLPTQYVFHASDRMIWVVGGLWIAALCIDDYLTGDDDSWRKFKDWARNKVKWRMQLPRTEHA